MAIFLRQGNIYAFFLSFSGQKIVPIARAVAQFNGLHHSQYQPDDWTEMQIDYSETTRRSPSRELRHRGERGIRPERAGGRYERLVRAGRGLIPDINYDIGLCFLGLDLAGGHVSSFY